MTEEWAVRAWRAVLFLSYGLPIVMGASATGAIVGALLAKQQYRALWLAALVAVAFAVLIGPFVYKSADTKRVGVIAASIVLVVSMLAAGAGVLAVYRTTGPVAYMIEKSISTSTVTDVQGRTGHFQLVDQIKILEDGVRLFKVRNLGATGQISNIKASVLDHPYDVQVYEEAGLWQVETRLLEPLKSGDRITKTLELDVLESKPEDKVYSIPRISIPTEYLEVNIAVPAARPCKSVEAWSRNGAKEGEALPQLSEDRTHVTWHKQNPQTGREYGVYCYW